MKAKCEVIENLADFQLRFYPPFVVAAVDYQKRDEGYLAIGDYISGANAAGTRLIQTQPVFLTLRPGASPSDLHKTMSVYVPSVAPAEGGGFQDLGKAPLPNDLNVRLEVEGGGLVAVGTIEGSVTPRIAGELVDLEQRDITRLRNVDDSITPPNVDVSRISVLRKRLPKRAALRKRLPQHATQLGLWCVTVVRE